MSLDPDVIDAMVVAGCTASMIAAIYRAYWAKQQAKAEAETVTPAVTRVTQTVTRNARVMPTVTPVTPATPKSAAAIRQKRWRDSKKQLRVTPVTVSVTRNAPSSLSLKEDSSSLEREGSVTPVTPAVTRYAVTLAADWQPNEEGAQLAAQLSDIGAANCIANFRDHFEASGKAMTPAEWQARFRIWVRKDLARASSGQSPLPLMRSVHSARGPPPVAVEGSVYLKRDTPQYDAWRRHTGKTFPQDRDGGWWFASEWPPEQAPRRESG